MIHQIDNILADPTKDSIDMKLILTVPLLGDFGVFSGEESVEGFRLNTNIPVKIPIEEVLEHAINEANGKKIWIDLKTRQLRVKDYGVRIYNDREVHCIKLSHNIKLNTPCAVYFDSGKNTGEVTEVINNNTLIVPSCIERRHGLTLASEKYLAIRPGNSVTITEPSLSVEGFLTKRDEAYLVEGMKLGINDYMVSFIEQKKDLTDILAINPDARICAKIESLKGLDFVSNHYDKVKNDVNLIAARGDLYLQLRRPHEIIGACKGIIESDPNAIAASRILESLANINEDPVCSDITDLYSLMQMGYKRFMLGDEVCRKKESVEIAIKMFEAIKETYLCNNGRNYK